MRAGKCTVGVIQSLLSSKGILTDANRGLILNGFKFELPTSLIDCNDVYKYLI